jgi:hypothetical protein
VSRCWLWTVRTLVSFGGHVDPCSCFDALPRCCTPLPHPSVTLLCYTPSDTPFCTTAPHIPPAPTCIMYRGSPPPIGRLIYFHGRPLYCLKHPPLARSSPVPPLCLRPFTFRPHDGLTGLPTHITVPALFCVTTAVLHRASARCPSRPPTHPHPPTVTR